MQSPNNKHNKKKQNPTMTLNEYQEQAMMTCMKSSNNFSYMILNLVGEVGEFASKVAKDIRKEKRYIGGVPNKGYSYDDGQNHLRFGKDIKLIDDEYLDKSDEELKKEAGDILWQLAGLCKVMGWSLEEVAALNLEKLAARKEAGTIDGNGDGVSGKERTV